VAGVAAPATCKRSCLLQWFRASAPVPGIPSAFHALSCEIAWGIWQLLFCLACKQFVRAVGEDPGQGRPPARLPSRCLQLFQRPVSGPSRRLLLSAAPRLVIGAGALRPPSRGGARVRTPGAQPRFGLHSTTWGLGKFGNLPCGQSWGGGPPIDQGVSDPPLSGAGASGRRL